MDADAIPIHACPEYPDAVCYSVCITAAHACPYCGALLGPLPDPVQLQPAAGRVPDGALGAGTGTRGDGTRRDGER